MTSKALIKKILTQVHPDTRISAEAVNVVQKLMIPIWNHIKDATPQDIRHKLLIIPLELRKHALSEYNNTRPNELTKHQNPNRVTEYLFAEILELAGNAARDNQKSTINPLFVYQAIELDEELYKLFKIYMPGFPFSKLEIDQNLNKLVITKTQINKISRSMSMGFKEGLLNIMRCLVSLYHDTKPKSLDKYSNAIAKRSGRKVSDKYKGIKLLQYEILFTIAGYALHIQPEGTLTLDTLLKATLANPYFKGLIVLPNILKQCLPKEKIQVVTQVNPNTTHINYVTKTDKPKTVKKTAVKVNVAPITKKKTKPTGGFANSSNDNLVGKSVVFSGFRDEDLEHLIIGAGGLIKTGVSKKTDYVVVGGKKGPGSSKAQKATQYGIPVMTYDNFLVHFFD